MVHVTISCPNCKKAVYSSTGRSYFYGSPIRTCPYCNHRFTHFQFHEIAIEGIRKSDKARITFGETIQLIIATAFLALPIYFFYNIFMVGSKPDSIDGIGFALLLILGTCLPSVILGMSPIAGLVGYKKRIEKLRQETIQSEKRLSNPEYARQLVKLGYSVPVKYLDISEGEENTTQQQIKPTNHDRFDEIKKYKDLLDNGIITKEEFNKKKNQILDL